MSENLTLWRCPDCNSVLCCIDADKQVRFKRRDMFVYISGDAKISTNCLKCGRINNMETIKGGE